MKKICKNCNLEKDSIDFRPNKAKKDGLQYYCKACDKIFQKQWYEKNKKRLIKKAIARNEKQKEVLRTYVLNYLKEHCCISCGESDIVVLEFDHLFDKQSTICDIINRVSSLTTLQKEISKCQVLCANCHRRKTAKDLGWWKSTV